VINSVLTANAQVGVAFSYQITATNNPTTYAASGLPSGVTINTTTGLISGIPTAAGTKNVTLSATNAGGTGTGVLVITVSAVNPANPVISSTTTAPGQVGVPFSYQITASNTPTSFSATGLPDGLGVNVTTGLISGTPTSAGVSTVTLGATNASGTGNKTLTITITVSQPVITSALTASGQLGMAFSYQITATNSPTSFAATGLPAGLGINVSTGLISGTPTTTGTSSVSISATNVGGTDSAILTITVNPPTPVITSGLSATGQVGVAFSYQITASNTPTSFGATGLPAGLTIDTTTGLISGTPTEASANNITISATNAGGTGTAVLAFFTESTVTIMRNGAALTNEKVYIYDEAGVDTGNFGLSDTNGMVRFNLPPGTRAKFRVDCDGQQKFSSVQTAPMSFVYTLPTTTTLALTKAGVLQAGKTVQAYNADGSTMNYSRVTDANGVASFCIDEGSIVKFRTDDSSGPHYSATVTTPAAATIELQADVPTAPAFTSASLRSGHFERGLPFEIVVLGDWISAGSVEVDFLSANGGLKLPSSLVLVNGLWVSTGSTPVNLPSSGSAGDSIPLLVVITLQSPSGEGATATVTLPLLNDTNPPAIIVDQPTPAVINAATTTISGTVSSDTTELRLTPAGTALTFDSATGHFSVSVPLQEGLNAFALVARDFLGNQAQVPFAITRTALAPVIVFTSPASFDTPVNTTSISIAGTVTAASTVQLSINGVAVPVGADGSFMRIQSLPNEGANSLTIVAESASHQKTTETRTIYRITEAPALAITSPAVDRFATRQPSIQVSGTVGSSAAALFVNTVPVADFANGTFSKPVPLASGENIITVEVRDALGNTRTVHRTVVLDQTPPTLTGLTLQTGFVTNSANAILAGRVVDGQTLTVNGENVLLGSDGSFSVARHLTEGVNVLTLETADALGNSAVVRVEGQLDTIAPQVVITSPLSGTTVAATTAAVSGTVDDPAATLTINSTSVTNNSGAFFANVTLTGASTTITVQAKDTAGNIGSKVITVAQDITPPVIAFTAPANGSTTNITHVRVAGTVDDSNATVAVNGQTATINSGAFEIASFTLAEGANLLTAVATDKLGNASAPLAITVTLDTTAPAKPTLVAPPAFVKADRVTLQGNAEAGATVSITGGLAPVSVAADVTGVFNATVLLVPNKAANLIINASDRAGNQSEPLVYTVISDTVAPVITVTRPAARASFDTSAIEVVGSVSDANLGATITVNGATVALSSQGQFGCHVTLPDGATQNIVVTAVDLAGNQAQVTRTVSVTNAPGDNSPPAITVLNPAYNASVPSTQISVTALITDESPIASVTIGGNPVAIPGANGIITAPVTVDANGEFTVIAVDSQGLTATITHRVKVESTAPLAPTIQRISPDSPTSESQVVLYGTAQASLRYEIAGGLLSTQTGTVGADGNFVATIQLNRNTTNHLQVKVVGENGISSPATSRDVVQDSVAPSVTSTVPAASADQVLLTSTIRIVFNEAVRAAELANIQVRAGASTVNCTRTLSSDSTTYTLTPNSPLSESTNVQVTVPSSVSDLAGNTLGSAYTLTFKTIDATAPASPVLDSTPARTNQSSVTISGTAEALSKITVTGGVSTQVTNTDATGRFTLSVNLLPNVSNTLQFTASDATGNTSAPKSVTIVHDNQALTLVSSVPANAADNVAPTTALTLTFNKAIDSTSLTGIALIGQAVVPTTASANAGVVTLTPSAALEAGKSYDIVIPATVADLFGNRLGAVRHVTFTTLASGPIAVPIVYSAQPTGVTNKLAATITGYSNPGTTLLVSGGAAPFTFPATGVIDTTGLFTVEVPLQLNAQNTIVLQAKDTQSRLSASVTALDVRQDAIAPTVVHTLPLTGATNVDPHASLFVEFSEAIQAAPLTATIPAIRLFDALNQVVSGSWILSSDARSVTFYATHDLTSATNYSLLIGTTVRDLGGNALTTPVSVNFRTAEGAATERPATPVLDPLASSKTIATAITLTGTAPVGSQIKVFGGQSGGSASVDANGRFSVTVSLNLNTTNSLAVFTEAHSTLSLPATVSVTQLKHAAAIRILSPQPNLEYNNRSITVAGVIDDPDSVKSISVAGAPAAIAGRFFFHQVILDEAAGAKTITAVATLKDDTTAEATVSFTLLVEAADTDTKAPIPRFIFPEDGDVLNGEVVETLLTVEEGVQLTSVDIDHVVAHQVVGNIFFIAAHMPQQGANTITVNAIDAAGLVGTASVNVVLDSVGPASAPVVSAQPSLTTNRVITLTGTAEPGTTIIVVNGLVPVRAVVGPDGTYSVTVPLNPNATNHLQVAAVDSAGNISSITTVDIAHDDTPPTIVSTSPLAGQTGVPQNSVIDVTFSEPLNPATVSTETAVILRSNLGQPIQRNAVLSADGKTLRITPAYKFLRGDTITVELAGTIADLHGFAMGSNQSFGFATVAHQTTVSGVVVDPQLRPLSNVKVGIKGSTLTQYTSSFGTFILDDAPVGDQILYVDARPDAVTGLPPQGDSRVFGYLEFFMPVRKDVDNTLGRPIFMVDTDLSTATQLATTGESNVLAFTPAEKDLTGFSITYRGGSVRFADGTTRGKLTATLIDPANIPDRLPSGAIPHFLVEIGPDGLVFDTPARLGFKNVYNLAAGAEVIVFQFKYGIHNYTEIGRAVVGADNRIITGEILAQSGFVGIIPADKSFDLTRIYLEGRVVDSSGTGLAGISVNAIAGSSYVVTDSAGHYSIPMPEVRLELIRTYATVSTDLGARSGESPSLVFQSAMVSLSPSGVTKIPDIVVDSFFLGGSIRYVDADGSHISVLENLTTPAYTDAGQLVSVDPSTVRGVEIFVYRRISAVSATPEYDTEPYMKTTAGLDRFDSTYDSSYALTFLGSLAASGQTSRIPVPGDWIKIVAFDHKTGFYGEADLKIPSASQATGGGGTPLDVLANLELRPPVVSLDMNRVFFLDGVRRRADIPHRGIAFTGDEYVEFKTTWTTPAAKPLDRAELSLPARLRVVSIDYKTDYGFTVRGGEQFRVLELREALVSDRLSILQRDTDVGIETFSVSRDGSFGDATLIPVTVQTDAYGLAQASAEVAETSSKAVELHILNLTITQNDGLDITGRTLPGATLNVGGKSLKADSKGYFSDHSSDSLGAGGLLVQVGDSLTTRYGEALTPVINALEATPAGLIPSRGSKGDRVVINGVHFSPVPTDNKVDFNGAAAVVSSASETQLTVAVPELASSGDVTVTIAGKKSNGVYFEFVSVGINNGSFEDGTLRAFTVEGSGQVVEGWGTVIPTDRQYMAFLDTMSDPRDGVSTLTSDAFEVPAGMQTLLFDYNFVATTLLKPVSDVVEFYIVAGSNTIRVPEIFSSVTLDPYSPISGFDRGSGFRTASVLVSQWAGTGQQIRIKIVLTGRGALPDYIPGMNADDHNPIGLGKHPGTGIFVDNFRLSSGYETALPALSTDVLSITSDSTAVTISAPVGSVSSGARIYIWDIASGDLHMVDADDGGHFTMTIPFSGGDDTALLLLSHSAPADGGRIFSPQTKLATAK